MNPAEVEKAPDCPRIMADARRATSHLLGRRKASMHTPAAIQGLKRSTERAMGTLQEVEKALDCPHIAADAALALNKVYSGLHEMEPEGGRYLIRWARILMKPSLLHIEQTCEALEQAIMGDTSDAVLAPEDRMRGEWPERASSTIGTLACGGPTAAGHTTPGSLAFVWGRSVPMLCCASGWPRQVAGTHMCLLEGQAPEVKQGS